MTAATSPFTLTISDFEAVRARIAPHIKHTPLLSSRQLSELTGHEVRVKAECFQRVGSYKIRGPLNKFALMPEEQKRRGVVCSSAGNHAQGVALAAQLHGPLLRPSDPDYDEVRSIWNGMIDKRPALIARCLDRRDEGRRCRGGVAWYDMG